MKKLIFHSSKFFGSGQFLIHEILKNWPKTDRSQKVCLIEKSILLSSSTSRRNFWILFILWLYFQDWFLKFHEARAKFCDLTGCSYLDNKCSKCLCLPPLWCTKLGVRSGLTISPAISKFYFISWKRGSHIYRCQSLHVAYEQTHNKVEQPPCCCTFCPLVIFCPYLWFWYSVKLTKVDICANKKT